MKYDFNRDNLTIRKRLDKDLNPVDGDKWNLVYDESFSYEDTQDDDITIIHSGTKFECRCIMHFILRVAHSFDPDTFPNVGNQESRWAWSYIRDLDFEDKKKEAGDKYVERYA